MGLKIQWVLFAFLCLPLNLGFGRDLPSAVQSFFTETIEWGKQERTHEEALERFQLVQDQLRVALYQLGYDLRKELGLSLEGVSPGRVEKLHAAFLPLRDLARGQKREVIKRLSDISKQTEFDTKLSLSGARATLSRLNYQYESLGRPAGQAGLSPAAAPPCRQGLSYLRLAGGLVGIAGLGGAGYWAMDGHLLDSEYLKDARNAYDPASRKKAEQDLLLLIEGDGVWGRPSAETQGQALALLAERYLLSNGEKWGEERAKTVERLIVAVQTGHIKIPAGYSAHHGAIYFAAVLEKARAGKLLSRDYLYDQARWIVEQPDQPAALRAMLLEFVLSDVSYEKAPEKLKGAIIQAIYDYTLAPESFRKDSYNSELRANRDPVEILLTLRRKDLLSAESLSEMLKFLRAQPEFAAALEADAEKAQAFAHLE